MNIKQMLQKIIKIAWLEKISMTFVFNTIIPLDIIKKLPLSIWDDTILDTHHDNDMKKYEVKTLKNFLLGKRTPKEIKDYLLSI